MHPLYLANIGSQCLPTARYQNTEVSQPKGIRMLIFHSDGSASESDPERWHSWALGARKKPEYNIAKTSDSQQISVAHKQLGSAQPQRASACTLLTLGSARKFKGASTPVKELKLCQLTFLVVWLVFLTYSQIS